MIAFFYYYYKQTMKFLLQRGSQLVQVENINIGSEILTFIFHFSSKTASDVFSVLECSLRICGFF